MRGEHNQGGGNREGAGVLISPYEWVRSYGQIYAHRYEDRKTLRKTNNHWLRDMIAT